MLFFLILTSTFLDGQIVKKKHGMIGVAASFNGNNEQYQDGFAFRFQDNFTKEYFIFESTAIGAKIGLTITKNIGDSPRLSSHVGPSIRQYLLGGLNIQATYLIRTRDINLFQGNLGYSFFSGGKFIIEPSIEYGKTFSKLFKEEYLSFGLGFRILIGRGTQRTF